MSSLYFNQLVRLAGQHGSLAEQQLLSRWQSELTDFFGPADRALMNNALGLEIGIEDTLALKINLKSRNLGAVPSLLAIARQSPRLMPWVDAILAQQLRFHCGIKITPTALSRKIYVYPKDHQQIAHLLDDPVLQDAITTVKPLFLGIDDHRGCSMYFPAAQTEWVNHLLTELGLPDWQGAEIWPWQQLRYDGTALIPGKTAIELHPLPAGVLARLATHYPFPCFRYLIPLKNHRSGNFGRDPVTGRFALYAGVN